MEDVLGRINGQPSRCRKVILRSNGIKTRYYVLDPVSGQPRYNNAELTAAAVRGLTGEGFTLEQMDVLCCGTSSPDQLLPNHGVMVQGLLGCGPLEVVTTAGVCMSGLAALKYGYLAVRGGESRNAVATGSEVASTFMRAKAFEPESSAKLAALDARPEIAFDHEFLRWMLSDGAGAALLEASPTRHGQALRIDWIESLSYAHELPTCMYAGAEKAPNGCLTGWREVPDLEQAVRRSVFAVHQDVRLLNEHIVHIAIEKGLAETIRRRGLAPHQVDWFLPHMSSEFFRKPIAASLERIGFALPMDRWYTNLTETGNIGSASMYVMLAGLLNSGGLRRGQRLLVMVPESGRFSVGYLHLTVV
jgi:3-oxoacyl-[acyl-carrier-protein] synthase-3